MQFDNLQLLWALLLLPLLLIIGAIGLARGKRAAETFAKAGNLKQIRPYHSPKRKRARFILMFTGLALVAFSVSGPKFGTAYEQVRSRGLDVVLGIDVSDSMLARDIRPSRLAFAKREIEHLVEQLKGDRIALLPFSGQAYLLCPMTLDYSAIRMFLGVIDTDIIPTEGTDLATAIDAARAAFDKTERKYRVMILLTDGEDLQGKALEAAKRAEEDGIVIFIMGIGTTDGEPIPIQDENGNVVYKKDKKGQVVISKINESTLSKVAKTTGGAYVKATYDDSARKAIFSRIEKMERRDQEGKLVTRFKARFQWFLIPGIILITLGLAIRKRGKAVGL